MAEGNPLSSKEILNLKEVSELLSLNTETVRLKAKAGLIPSAHRIGHGAWRFSRTIVTQWAEAKQQTMRPEEAIIRNKKGGSVMPVPAKLIGRTGNHWQVNLGKQNLEVVLNEQEGQNLLAYRQISFGDLAEEWMDGKAHANIANTKSSVKMLKKEFGDRMAVEINRAAVMRFIKKMEEGQYLLSTIKQRLQVLKAVLRYGMDMGYFQMLSPFKKEDIAKGNPSKPRRAVKPEEMKRIFAAAKNDYPHMIPVIKVAILTGMRRSELENLKWDDIKDSKIDVLGKGRKLRSIPVCKELRSVLDGLKRNGNSHVFTYFNETYNKTTAVPVGFHFTKILEKAGLKEKGKRGELCLHALRHTAGTEMVAGGADLRSVQDIMGHSSLAVTQVYIHENEEAKKRAVGVLGKAAKSLFLEA